MFFTETSTTFSEIFSIRFRMSRYPGLTSPFSVWDSVFALYIGNRSSKESPADP